MGGRPLFALNLVAWPSSELPTSVLAEVLAGGAEIAAEGGFAVVGGHSVDDPEPKYGLAVVGEVHPDRVLTQRRAARRRRAGAHQAAGHRDHDHGDQGGRRSRRAGRRARSRR